MLLPRDQLVFCDICVLLLFAVAVIYTSKQVVSQELSSTNNSRPAKLSNHSANLLQKLYKSEIKNHKRLKLIKLRPRDLEKLKQQDASNDESFSPLPGDDYDSLLKIEELEATLGAMDFDYHSDLPAEGQSSLQRLDSSSPNSSIDSNELERLVRNQVALAANDWATMSPPVELPPEDYHEKLWSIDPNATVPINETPYRKEKTKANRVKSNNKYSNHNYENHQDQDNRTIGNSHLASGSWHDDIFAILRPTNDPMTTLSDGSSDYLIVEHTPSPNLIRGQSQSSGSRETTSLSKNRVKFPQKLEDKSQSRFTGSLVGRPRVASTLAPSIVKTFQRLDQAKSKTSSHSPQRTGQIRAPDTETSGSANVIRNAPPLGTQLNQRVGSVSPDGFMDLPAQILSNAQQLVEQTNESSPLEEDRSTVNTTIADGGFRNSFGDQDQGQHHSRHSVFKTNLNGDLAARLNANRYKNRVSNYDILGAHQQHQVAPLSVTINRSPGSIAHRMSDHLSGGQLAGAITPLPLTTSMHLDTAAQNQNARHPVVKQNFSTPRTTTPSTSTTSTTAATLSPNLISAIYAAALNNTRSSLPKKLAHHHLHSHVHSIKPAVISMPDLKANLPAFNPYDSILAAAAAAAAAAATASSSRNRVGKVGAGQTTNLRHTLSQLPSIKPQVGLSRGGETITNTDGHIPIGGNAQSLRKMQRPPSQQQNQQQDGSNPTIASSTIFSTLLESANRALRQVAGGTGGRSSLLAANSDQVASTHHDPNQGTRLAPGMAIYTPRYQLLQRGGSGGSLTTPDANFMQFTDPFASTPSSDSMRPSEVVGLHQVDSEDNSLLTSYLANLLANQQLIDNVQSNDRKQQAAANDAFLSAMEGEVAASYNNPITQDDLFGWDSNATGGLPSILPDGVMFAPLGEDSNILYPFFAPHLSGDAKTNSTGKLTRNQRQQQQQQQHLELDSLWNQQASLSPKQVAWLGEQPATFLSSLGHSRQPQAQQVVSSSGGGGRRNPIPLKKHLRSSSGAAINGRVKLPNSAKSRGVGSQLESSEMIPYAITHYMDEHRQLATSNHLEGEHIAAGGGGNGAHFAGNRNDSNSNNPNQLIRDIFDEKEVVRFAMPSQIQFLATDGINSEKGQSNGEKQSKSPVANAAGNTQIRKVHQVRSVRPLAAIGAGGSEVQNGATLTLATGPEAAQSWRPLHRLVQLAPAQPPSPYQVYPGEALQQALVHASSSLRPHLMAAGDLLHHGQELFDHHYLHHHHYPRSQLLALAGPQDMATSESARMAAIAAGPTRWPLISHIWPLALALLPLMILVAIVAQLVMAAPLVMFALTTMTVSRFAGLVFGAPPIASRREAKTTISLPPMTTSERSMTPEPPFPSQTFLPVRGRAGGNSTRVHDRRRRQVAFKIEDQINSRMIKLLERLKQEDH